MVYGQQKRLEGGGADIEVEVVTFAPGNHRRNAHFFILLIQFHPLVTIG